MTQKGKATRSRAQSTKTRQSIRDSETGNIYNVAESTCTRQNIAKSRQQIHTSENLRKKKVERRPERRQGLLSTRGLLVAGGGGGGYALS